MTNTTSQEAAKAISVYCAAERVGLYKVEQDAIVAALDYSRDTERPVVIDYNDGTYQETWTNRQGEWQHGPIYRERKSDGAPIVTGVSFREAAE